MKVVKSAQRVLDILEYFSVVRKPVSVSEIEQAIELPQSSASVLLRSLVELGYLEYLPDERLFRPTLRVAKLGDWIQHGLPGPLTIELEKLRNQLQETIILGRRQGDKVEFIYLLIPDRSVQFYARRNSLQLMTLSVVGRTLLGELPETRIRLIVRSNNAEAKNPESVVDENAIMQAIEETRKSGIAESSPAFGGEREFHVIAKLLPRAEGLESLAVGVAGPRARMLKNRDTVIQALEDWVAQVSVDDMQSESGDVPA